MKAGLRGDALGSQVIDALDDQTGCFRPALPGLFTPRSKKRSLSAAGERRLAAGNGHRTAFATVGSARIIFRSHYKRSRRFG